MALERFSKTVDLQAAPAQAWAILTDVKEITTWVNIIHEVVELEHLKSYTAVLEDRVGPFHLRADLSITVQVLEDGSHIHVDAAGKDRSVNSKIDIHGDLILREELAGRSELEVTGRYQVTGRVATLGAGIIRKKGDLAVQQFFDNAQHALGSCSSQANS